MVGMFPTVVSIKLHLMGTIPTNLQCSKLFGRCKSPRKKSGQAAKSFQGHLRLRRLVPSRGGLVWGLEPENCYRVDAASTTLKRAFSKEPAMKSFMAFLLGVVLGAGGVFLGQGYHILRTADGYELVRKTRPSFKLIYVDVRQYLAEDWLEHPQLAQAVLEAKKGHLMQEAVRMQVHQAVDELLKKVLPGR
jgi:hypothetical protein